VTRTRIEAALIDAIERLRADGDPCWPGEEVAPIAYRRLTTFARRNRSKAPSEEHRVRDLVKGLQAHFEPDIPYTHSDDWRALAIILVTAFDRTARESAGAAEDE
jgi:hypothetical protein